MNEDHFMLIYYATMEFYSENKKGGGEFLHFVHHIGTQKQR
jgi:hypothetical protein